MSTKNLTIELNKRKDNEGKNYYVGKLEAPITIDCSEGVTFLVFVADDAVEELQIAKMDKKKNAL